MFATWGLLLQSRKFWIGIITLLAISGAITLVAIGKLDQAALVSTITAITGLGIATIGSIAWEDTTKAKANGSTNQIQAVSEMVTSAVKSINPPAIPKEETDASTTP